MNRPEIRKAKEDNSCNCCGKVETVYEVKIGCMVNRLCADCLAELIGKAIAELAKEK